MHGDRRAPSDRHHAVPEYLGAYGARHPPVHFAGDLLLHVLPQGAVTVILFYCVRHQWFKYILGELLVYHKILVNL